MRDILKVLKYWCRNPWILLIDVLGALAFLAIIAGALLLPLLLETPDVV